LLPIFLLLNGQIDFAIGADIAQKPLETGYKNAVLYGVDKRMCFVLSNGLAEIADGNGETCIIAGMGGEAIMSILSAHVDVARSFKQFILSPQRNVPDVRRFLHRNGFGILDEAMVLEDGKFYHVLDCVPTKERVVEDDNPYGYSFGKHLVERKDPVLQLFIHREVEKYGKIDISALPYVRQMEIKKYLRLCHEILEGWVV